MTFMKHHRVLALLAIAFGVSLSVPATAQDRSEVREVLNRAETQAARRAVEELLGSIGGIGRAEAQTLPAPGAPDAARSSGTQPAVPQAQTVPSAQSPVPPVAAVSPNPVAVPPTAPVAAASSPIGVGGQNAVTLSASTGTPAQPTMIVRVPAAPEQPAVPSTATRPAVATTETAIVQGRASSTSAPATGSFARSGAPAIALTARPGTAASQSAAVRLAAGRMGPQDWCPPPSGR